MATITKKRNGLRQFGGAAGAYGNLSILRFQLKTNASGAVINSDTTAAIGVGDKIDLGPLPAGFSLDDASITVSTGLTSTLTGKLGFEYEDGVNDASVPQDDDYFGTGLDLATAARLRTVTAVAPVVLPKPARLILTTAVIANAKAGQVDIAIVGELTGDR